MNRAYDLVTIASGEQFLVQYEECLYAGIYDEVELRVELESRAVKALYNSSIPMKEIERTIQALTAELMSMQLSDNVDPVEVTWLGE